ncbi:MAG: AraC family transcriptional regulator [Chitinophaga sp.]|uniref:helix-turn-helix domain-containing protein n=1 Tax=Chitinophaga sp. TaxID=1869181 RepID=UPI0025C6F626|nr:helix-turn-helix domain-containing protein [Chitinophaga sp.]MBV8253878.1 AraC family transcriptional regulator [Chitinophaga sp.]
MDKPKQPLLLFSTGYFIYIGRAVDTTVHAHHAIQMVASLQDEIEIVLPDSTMKVRAILIDSDEPHKCKTGDNTFLLINIDPECTIGKGLKSTWLAGKKAAALPETTVKRLLAEIEPSLSGDWNRDTIFNSTLQFLRGLSHTDRNEALDDRIAKILKVLHQPGHLTFKVKDLAEMVYLSPSRLVHLFTAQVGIPIRKYVLWARLLTSLQHIIQASDITAAALEGGFSDAPHFNRTFKRMFGAAPTSLLKNSQIIQA